MDVNTSDLNAVLRVIDFLADPVSYRAKIAELLEASNTAQVKIDEAQAASVALDEKKSEQTRQMQTALAEHQSQLDDDRETFKRAAAEKSADILRRETAVAAAEKRLATERQEVADLRADLDQRIASFNKAIDPRPFPRAVPA